MPVRNILVVDDSPTERFFTVDVLTKAGYQVTTAENGEEGIAKAKASKPDLILMDVDEEAKNVPRCVGTTEGQETDAVWRLRQGAVDYLVKPLNPEQLLQRIAALP